VLCYAQQNNVEPFLEPVLLLANAMMVQDASALAVSGSRGELLSVFLSQLLTFADLCTYADAAVALAAAQCLARLVSRVWKWWRGWWGHALLCSLRLQTIARRGCRGLDLDRL